MFKSKPLMMLITGLLLALVLWTVIQVLQKQTVDNELVPISAEQENPLNTAKPTKPLLVQNANAPASILSAVQSGPELSDLSAPGVATVTAIKGAPPGSHNGSHIFGCIISAIYQQIPGRKGNTVQVLDGFLGRIVYYPPIALVRNSFDIL